MSNYARYRDWHMWIGLILLLPMSVIAATGFLWNHEKTLGIKVEQPEKYHKQEPESPPTNAGDAVALVSHPSAWQDHADVVTAALAEARNEWGSDVPLERIELKSEPGMGLVVKVKASEESDIRPYEIVWSANAGRIVERKGDPKAGTDWAKIVHDLHTGKFFSRQYGFLWSDSSALAILALGVTGVVLYAIPALKKRAKKQKASVPVTVRPALPRTPVIARLSAAAAIEGEQP